MSQATLTLSDDHILCRTPFTELERCRAAQRMIRAGRWNPSVKAWMFPATIDACETLLACFPRAECDDGVLELWEKGNKAVVTERTYDDRPFERVKLRPWRHQAIGGRLIEAQDGTYLAHDMGTGKTKTVIDAIMNLGLFPAIVFCPKSAVDVWPAEFAIHSVDGYFDKPLTVTVLSGPLRKRCDQIVERWALAKINLNHMFVFVTNYEALNSKRFVAAVCEHQWGIVVCDEAHRIKKPGGVQSMALAKIRAYARKRACLSGTPMSHSPLDLYAQMRFCDPSIFGKSFTRFRSRYAVMGGYNSRQVLGFCNQDELRAKFYSIAHHVSKADVLPDLPSQTHQTRAVALCKTAQIIYDRLEREFYAEVDQGIVTASNALVKLLRLQQITGGHIKVENKATGMNIVTNIDDAKLDELRDLLAEDLSVDESVVVFCRFTRDVERIMELCAEIGRAAYRLDRHVHDLPAWKAAPLGAVLVANIQSGDVSVDMTKACYVVYYSLGFSFGQYEQSQSRLHRQGQTRPVTYVHLVAKDTIDEKIYRALQDKQDVIQAILKGHSHEQNLTAVEGPTG